MLNHIESLPRSRSARKQGVQTTRERLLAVGLHKVLESGWAATSIDLVLRECGVPKGSFYHYFASKEVFGYAVLESYQATMMERLRRWFVETNPRDGAGLHAAMEGFLAESVASLQSHQYQRGCLVGALGQELASVHAGFRAKLVECLSEWDKTLSSALFNSVASYQINSKSTTEKMQETGLLHAQCDAWARDFWTAWQGALLRCLLTRSPAALQAMVQSFWLQLGPRFGQNVPQNHGVKAPRSMVKRPDLDQGKRIKKSKNINKINDIQEKFNF